jgi:hypothetical protein
MNCEKCRDLLSEFVDGSLGRSDYAAFSAHLEECLECADVRNDLNAIVSFCREQRGTYEAPPNERALWVRIRNVIESQSNPGDNPGATVKKRTGWLGRMGHRSWELTFPQMAASIAGIVVVVALATGVGMRRFGNKVFGSAGSGSEIIAISGSTSSPEDRIWQQQQAISYWNQRVELNKARWSPQMRETFDRNLKVIDQAVNNSLAELRKNPHDEVSEEMLNSALNDKMALLREFSDL